MTRPTTLATAVVALVTSALGCFHSDAPRPPGPLASALLALAAELDTDPQVVAASWTSLKEIAGRVASRQEMNGGELVDNLNGVVMGDLHFEREVELTDPAFMLLPGVISGRRGTCLGLGALYLAIAERLDRPLEGVLVPGHFFIRTPGPTGRNVELLHRGEAVPDSWYRAKYGPWPATTTQPIAATPLSIPAPAASAYGRAVSIPELAALHWFNAGNNRRQAGDLATAERDYARAAADFPALAEARASLGAMLQLRGALDDAAEAYRAAARARADLPGLAHNLALLEAERSHRAAPPNADNADDDAPAASAPASSGATPSAGVSIAVVPSVE